MLTLQKNHTWCGYQRQPLPLENCFASVPVPGGAPNHGSGQPAWGTTVPAPHPVMGHSKERVTHPRPAIQLPWGSYTLPQDGEEEEEAPFLWGGYTDLM